MSSETVTLFFGRFGGPPSSLQGFHDRRPTVEADSLTLQGPEAGPHRTFSNRPAGLQRKRKKESPLVANAPIY